MSDVASNFDVIGETCVGFAVETCSVRGSLYNTGVIFVEI